MKAAMVLLSSSVAALVPSAALACPGMNSQACGLGSLGGYVAAVAIGLLVGIGSVALERGHKRP